MLHHARSFSRCLSENSRFIHSPTRTIMFSLALPRGAAISVLHIGVRRAMSCIFIYAVIIPNFIFAKLNVIDAVEEPTIVRAAHVDFSKYKLSSDLRGAGGGLQLRKQFANFLAECSHVRESKIKFGERSSSDIRRVTSLGIGKLIHE